MTLPARDSIQSFGGPYFDLSTVIDPTTDISAASDNPALSDTAMMTRTACRAWCRFTPAGAGTPVLNYHNALWGNTPGVAPVVIYGGSTGLYQITWPATVQDDIPSGYPGYTGPQTLVLLAGDGNCTSLATAYNIQVLCQGNNSAAVAIFTGGALNNPSGVAFEVFVY